MFARKGDVLNPLKTVPFMQTLYFIDGDDPDQVAWMKRQVPDLDITGMWVLAVGVFFHLIARLVRKQPELAIQAGEVLGLGMVIFGGYRILNALIAEAEKQEKAREKQTEDN